MLILFLRTDKEAGIITLYDSQQRPFMNSKYYLAISDSMIQRSPQITTSLIEFSSVCIGITFLPQVTHTHKLYWTLF